MPTSSLLLNELNKYSNADIILVDVNNNAQAISRCDEIIYLIEPSMIKLNKLMMTMPQTLKDLKDKIKNIINAVTIASSLKFNPRSTPTADNVHTKIAVVKL